MRPFGLESSTLPLSHCAPYNLDIFMNAYIKFGEILSLCFKDIKGNEILTSIKSHNCYKNAKMTPRSSQYQCIHNIW